MAASAKLAPDVANHPNRRKLTASAARTPTPAEIRTAREAAGLTQTEAAAKIGGTLKAWQNYEADTKSGEHRRMHPGLFELFLIKTGQPVKR